MIGACDVLDGTYLQDFGLSLFHCEVESEFSLIFKLFRLKPGIKEE